MNEIVSPAGVAIESFAKLAGLHPRDLMVRQFLMPDGGNGTEITFTADPSCSSGRVKIDPSGNFIVFQSPNTRVISVEDACRSVSGEIARSRQYREGANARLADNVAADPLFLALKQ